MNFPLNSSQYLPLISCKRSLFDSLNAILSDYVRTEYCHVDYTSAPHNLETLQCTNLIYNILNIEAFHHAVVMCKIVLNSTKYNNVLAQDK